MVNENNVNNETQKALFVSLISMLQGTAMQALGKIMNPLTQQAERNLPQAQLFIDMLGMIKEKTYGNLSVEETQFLDHMLFELRMNYVDETKREETEKAKPAEAPAETQEEPVSETATGEETVEKPTTAGTPSEKHKEEQEPEIKAKEKVNVRPKATKKSARKKSSTTKKSKKSSTE